MDDNIRIVLPQVESVSAMFSDEPEAFYAAYMRVVADENDGSGIRHVTKPYLAANEEPVRMVGNI